MEEADLAERLNEGHGLDVTDGAAKLDDAHIRRPIAVVHGDVRHALNPVLDGICDVRHNLDCLSQVVPSALPLYHRLHHKAPVPYGSVTAHA